MKWRRLFVCDCRGEAEALRRANDLLTATLGTTLAEKQILIAQMQAQASEIMQLRSQRDRACSENAVLRAEVHGSLSRPIGSA